MAPRPRIILPSTRNGRGSSSRIWRKPFNPDDVTELLRLVAAGRLRPVIDRRFPLADIVQALRWVDDGHARGKVIVTVDGAAASPQTTRPSG